MVQLIVGEKGNGKTKILLEQANTRVKSVNGNIVYLDKNKQHMYELNNKVRLIDVTGYALQNTDQFVGFLCGIISQDNDLEVVYLDSFLKIAAVGGDEVLSALDKISKVSESFNVDFVISMSVAKEQLPEQYADKVLAEC